RSVLPRLRPALGRHSRALWVSRHPGLGFAVATRWRFSLCFRRANLRAVVAQDYFRVGSLIGWIARRIFGAITADRAWRPPAGDPLAGCSSVLDASEILILYLEGTRGVPGRMSDLKAGVAYLARHHPKVPVVPIALNGVERVRPKGAVVPLPLTVTADVGMPRYWGEATAAISWPSCAPRSWAFPRRNAAASRRGSRPPVCRCQR